jgi:nucleotide-binding universal stress UspA family protein
MIDRAQRKPEPRIVVGYKGGERSGDALAFGVRLVRDLGAHITLAAAFPYLRAHAGSEAFELALGRKSDPLFAEARDQVSGMAPGLFVRERAVGGFPVARLLSRLASDEDADLLALGSNHRAPLARAFLGGVGEQVIRVAPCPVAVVPSGYTGWPAAPMKVVGAAYDGTGGAERAVRQATAIARAASATLRIVAVVEPIGVADIAYAPTGPEPRFSREILERTTEDLLVSLPGDLDADRVILSGDPVDRLVDATAEDLDALVIGSHADAPILRAFLGSVSTPVVRRATFPVVVVPPHARLGFGASDDEGPVRLSLRARETTRANAGSVAR